MDKKGKLYIVATPIGNKDDITLRAVHTLETVDIIAAEDTRHTGKFLGYHNIRTKLISCHEYNERERTPGLINKLKQGASVAIVSDAGTPSVSDPGYWLVKEAVENGITVVPVPGVSAVITAISAAGLPTDTFVFIGFPAKKKGKRLAQMEKLSGETGTIIFYESPKRILSFIKEIITVMGDRYGVLAREMTKIHEEFLRGLLSDILNTLKERPSVKGECVLLISGCKENEAVPLDTVRTEIKNALETEQLQVSELSKKIAKKYGLPKNKVYEEALMIKKGMDNG
ncbi:16S rRNA (cytidine(1402)-2'-O)-methyltransferase [Desulfonema magnum]|nr:16S rRNA (cytidine(1402)-2'-O)-methyltransferase [Desulfonema magnum]